MGERINVRKVSNNDPRGPPRSPRGGQVARKSGMCASTVRVHISSGASFDNFWTLLVLLWGPMVQFWVPLTQFVCSSDHSSASKAKIAEMQATSKDDRK